MREREQEKEQPMAGRNIKEKKGLGKGKTREREESGRPKKLKFTEEETRLETTPFGVLSMLESGR